ncbi:MAG: hypothetical protein GY821_10260 [Gammaproteobacteria bacterium]|nr:hypothetical protein [Gammaproteobacteria bacterium]
MLKFFSTAIATANVAYAANQMTLQDMHINRHYPHSDKFHTYSPLDMKIDGFHHTFLSHSDTHPNPEIGDYTSIMFCQSYDDFSDKNGSKGRYVCDFSLNIVDKNCIENETAFNNQGKQEENICHSIDMDDSEKSPSVGHCQV